MVKYLFQTCFCLDGSGLQELSFLFHVQFPEEVFWYLGMEKDFQAGLPAEVFRHVPMCFLQ